jgi:hypothetical protein
MLRPEEEEEMEEEEEEAGVEAVERLTALSMPMPHQLLKEAMN